MPPKPARQRDEPVARQTTCGSTTELGPAYSHASRGSFVMPIIARTPWSIERARKAYSIPYWADGYFDVDGQGRMCVLPRGAGGPMLALPEILADADAAGFK